jgi:hypothetical protein
LESVTSDLQSMVGLVSFQLHGQLVQEAVGYGARQGGLDRSEYQVEDSVSIIHNIIEAPLDLNR